MKRTYKHVDQPKNQFSDPNRFSVPIKARTSEGIAERVGKPRGLLTARMQHAGTLVTIATLQDLRGDDLTEAISYLAPAPVVTDAYLRMPGAKVMRSELSVPRLAHEDDDWRCDGPTALLTALSSLAISARQAAELTEATATRSPLRYRLARQYGRSVGNAGLQLACVDLADMTADLSAFDVQDIARSECLATMQQAVRLSDEIGVYPSLAQLAESKSPLAVHISNNASPAVYTAFENALDRYALAS